MKRFRLYIEILAAILVIGAIVWIFFGNYLAIGKPVIKFDQDITSIGKQKTVGIIFSDSKSGLSHLSVEIIQDNKGRILVDKKIPARGIKQEILSLTVNPGEMKLHDGQAEY